MKTGQKQQAAPAAPKVPTKAQPPAGAVAQGKPSAPPTANPGEGEATAEDGEAKKRKRKPDPRRSAPKVFHPALEPKELEHPRTKKLALRPSVKLKSIPDDYDPAKHKPLGRTDLEDESLWFELRARDLERKAADLRKQGEDIKKLGGAKDKTSAKKMAALLKRIDDLTKGLDASGVDTTEIKANLLKSLQEKLAGPQKPEGEVAQAEAVQA